MNFSWIGLLLALLLFAFCCFLVYLLWPASKYVAIILICGFVLDAIAFKSKKKRMAKE
jgi:hypothetical protein